MKQKLSILCLAASLLFSLSAHAAEVDTVASGATNFFLMDKALGNVEQRGKVRERNLNTNVKKEDCDNDYGGALGRVNKFLCKLEKDVMKGGSSLPYTGTFGQGSNQVTLRVEKETKDYIVSDILARNFTNSIGSGLTSITYANGLRVWVCKSATASDCSSPDKFHQGLFLLYNYDTTAKINSGYVTAAPDILEGKVLTNPTITNNTEGIRGIYDLSKAYSKQLIKFGSVTMESSTKAAVIFSESLIDTTFSASTPSTFKTSITYYTYTTSAANVTNPNSPPGIVCSRFATSFKLNFENEDVPINTYSEVQGAPGTLSNGYKALSSTDPVAGNGYCITGSQAPKNKSLKLKATANTCTNLSFLTFLYACPSGPTVPVDDYNIAPKTGPWTISNSTPSATMAANPAGL
jgi:hypothetical protein